MKNDLVIAFFVVLLMLAYCTQQPAQSRTFPDKYDRSIKAAASRWMPGVPWRLYKAQLWQESRLDPAARSPAGAEGLAQFMPGTWADTMRALGTAGQPRTLAQPSIEAGAYYMSRLRGQWTTKRPEQDRHDLSLASYNAGLGNILAAQRACKMAVLYQPIMACLPLITGRHAEETLNYAPLIRKWWSMMEAGQ